MNCDMKGFEPKFNFRIWFNNYFGSNPLTTQVKDFLFSQALVRILSTIFSFVIQPLPRDSIIFNEKNFASFTWIIYLNSREACKRLNGKVFFAFFSFTSITGRECLRRWKGKERRGASFFFVFVDSWPEQFQIKQTFRFRCGSTFVCVCVRVNVCPTAVYTANRKATENANSNIDTHRTISKATCSCGFTHCGNQIFNIYFGMQQLLFADSNSSAKQN